MARELRATFLLRAYLEDRVDIAKRAESTANRSFLRAYNAASRDSDGQPVGLQIGIEPGPQPLAGNVFAYIPRVGRAEWLPVLVTDFPDKLEAIHRETSAIPRVQVIPARSSKPRNDDEPRRRVVIPKQETVLLPG